MWCARENCQSAVIGGGPDKRKTPSADPGEQPAGAALDLAFQFQFHKGRGNVGRADREVAYQLILRDGRGPEAGENSAVQRGGVPQGRGPRPRGFGQGQRHVRGALAQ